MKLADVASEMQSLLDAPSPAVLTLYRADGEALVSPVWFRLYEGFFEVVVAATDHKLEHLRRDPRCVLLVFETVAPFPGRPGTGQGDTRARRRRPDPPGHRLALSRRCAWPQVRGPRPTSTRLHRPPCDE
ncbi:MAG: pyridoxamine 5'-phosphate oxidase family protein [Chloroflexi bacterium]|nr:pyridoxamine 5'-phosphate oxidase family protein [Chloroflexota bacterium]